MVENKHKDNNSYSFVNVATEGINMKEEQKRMLERKGKVISSLNEQKQEKGIDTESVDVKQTETEHTHTRFSENLTPSENTRSNEGGKIEQAKKVKTKELRYDKRRNYVQVRILLTEQEQNILRLYLSSADSNLSSFVSSLVCSKIKSIRKELTEQGIKALLGIEDKE